MSDEDKNHYQKIVEILDEMGHKVIANHVLKKDKLTYRNQTEEESLENQRKLTKWKRQADLVVAEVSHPSLGVGQEIALSLAANKPVVALYLSGREPHILRDEGGDLLLIVPYSTDNIKRSLEDAIDYAAERQDTRFNFFVSPSIVNYLDNIARKERIPRAVYLRRLIEEDMKGNTEYTQSQ